MIYIPLSEMPEGSEAEVVGFRGCGRFVRRANNIGFHIGVKIKKLQSFGRRSLVQIGNFKVGLGRIASQKILVKVNKREVNE